MNGSWSGWSNYTECEDNMKTRTRLCDDPEVSYGGFQCLLSDGSGQRDKNESESITCKDVCPGMCTGWVFYKGSSGEGSSFL